MTPASRYDYDLFVIGIGSGGARAARMAAHAGARVAAAERDRLGGACVNVGCIPKKLMTYAAEYGDAFAHATGYGWRCTPPTFDWSVMKAARDREILRLNGVYERLLTDAGVRLLRGEAYISDAHTVTVDGAPHSAARVLIATGGRPILPAFPGQEHALTSDDFFHLPIQPQRALVVGGGYVAVELTGILNSLGSAVTLAYRGPLFLRGFDGDLRRYLATAMTARGVDVRFETTVAALERSGPNGPVQARLDDGTSVEVDAVLYATGRRPNSDGIGLEALGVALSDRGAIRVDDGFQSTVPGLYALGDVIDRTPLTPVAIAEAMNLTARLYGAMPRPMTYQDIPTAVFSQPPLATVGLSEEAAQARHGADAVMIYRSTFRPLRNALSGATEQTLVKLVVHRDSDLVLGVHMGGVDAAEIVQGLAIAVKAGLTKAAFDATMPIHPTVAEEFVTLRDPVA